jgi:hypothetical protein
VFQPHRRIVGDPAREFLVVGKRLFQEFFLERIEPVVEADVGDLGQHLDRMTRPPALALSLFLLVGNQNHAGSQGDCRCHQENGGRSDIGLVPTCPAQDAGGPGISESLHRLVGKIPLNFLCQLGRGGVPLGRGFPQCLQADALQALRNLGKDQPGRGRSFLANLADDFGRLGRDEWRPAGQNFVEDWPESVNVGALVDQIVVPLGLFGRHVRRRPQQLPLHRPFGTGTRFAFGRTTTTSAGIGAVTRAAV